MAKQNIYDNETFFEGYKRIRENEANANNLFEIPALFSLLPDLTAISLWNIPMCSVGREWRPPCKKTSQKSKQKWGEENENSLVRNTSVAVFKSIYP